MTSGSVAGMVAVLFSMVSIRLMMVVESAHGAVIGTISQQLQPDRIVAAAVGTHKFFVLNLSIAFLSRISYLIFWAEGMYPERLVHGAALGMMNTVVITGRTRVRAAAHHTRRAAKKVGRDVTRAASYPKRKRSHRNNSAKYYAAPVRF